MYELRMANEKENYFGQNVVVVIVLEHIAKTRLPVEVLQHFRKDTYIEMPKQEQNMELFWNAVCKSLSYKL